MKLALKIFILLSQALTQNVISNIDSYDTDYIIYPNEGIVQISTFSKIYNSNLQFIKEDSFFKSKYELAIFLISDDGTKLNSIVVSDSIIVNNFSDTLSKSNPSLIYSSFKMPSEDFKIQFNLKDLDTKKTGKKVLEVDNKTFLNNSLIKIYEPVFLEKRIGDWSLGIDKYPSKSNRIIPIEGKIDFNQFFELKSGKYLINYELFSEKNKIWNNSFNGYSKDQILTKNVKIPVPVKNKDLKIKVTLTQGDDTTSSTFPIVLRKNFMNSLEEDLSLSLKQMSYILTKDEKKELKSLSKLEKESFFKKVWAKRDPDPTTKKNELMDEYFKRVNYANSNFSMNSTDGWASDMGMIHILFGSPDDISRSSDLQRGVSYVTWYYYSIGKNFRFIDEFGFRDYRLIEPFF